MSQLERFRWPAKDEKDEHLLTRRDSGHGNGSERRDSIATSPRTSFSGLGSLVDEGLVSQLEQFSWHATEEKKNEDWK